MFDSSKQQPDPRSNIDFLHNDARSDRSSHIKKDVGVELANIEPRHASVVPPSVGVFKHLLDGIKHLLNKTSKPGSLGTVLQEPEHSSTSQVKSSKDHRTSGGHMDVEVSFLNDLSHQVPQHKESSSPQDPKGKPIEKIPLSKFRDHTLSKQPSSVPSKGRASVGVGLYFHSDKVPESDEIDVNLLPEQRHKISPQTKRILSIIGLSFEFICLIVGFLALQAKADGRLLGLRELESQQTLLDIQVKRYREVVKEASMLQQQASMLKQVLGKRVPYLEILSWFEANTIDSAYYTTFSVSESGEVNVHVVTKSSEDALYQMTIFSSTKSWEKVETSSVSLRQEEELFPVEFDVLFKGFIVEPSKDS